VRFNVVSAQRDFALAMACRRSNTFHHFVENVALAYRLQLRASQLRSLPSPELNFNGTLQPLPSF
jgi:hypothetical protein